MKTYMATATREEDWWVVEVDGLGATQGRTTAEAQRMAVDLVAAMEDVPERDVTVDITFVPAGELAAEVRRAREETRLAAEAQARASIRMRAAVGHLLAAGMSKQDAARILKVSPQRVSQLVKVGAAPDQRSRNG